MAEEVYQSAIVSDADGEDSLDVDLAIRSAHYENYLRESARLTKVNLDDMGPYKRIAFFLNVY
jgi:hypothetical protein